MTHCSQKNGLGPNGLNSFKGECWMENGLLSEISAITLTSKNVFIINQNNGPTKINPNCHKPQFVFWETVSMDL